MPWFLNSTRRDNSTMSKGFHERFNIKVGLEDAQQRFINRVYNMLFLPLHVFIEGEPIRNIILTALGEKSAERRIRIADYYVGNEFYKCLHVLEIVYSCINDLQKKKIDKVIQRLLKESEVDLGLNWDSGQFNRAGAKLLDDELVNQPLRWLSEKKHESVLAPFKKGLNHFLRSKKNPEILSDVITDMYEALETLAKIVTGKNRDLSSNAELFISKLKFSPEYRKILKAYITEGCKFRHGTDSVEAKPVPSEAEVESFVYLTGLFIRFAIMRC